MAFMPWFGFGSVGSVGFALLNEFRDVEFEALIPERDDKWDFFSFLVIARHFVYMVTFGYRKQLLELSQTECQQSDYEVLYACNYSPFPTHFILLSCLQISCKSLDRLNVKYNPENYSQPASPLSAK